MTISKNKTIGQYDLSKHKYKKFH